MNAPTSHVPEIGKCTIFPVNLVITARLPGGKSLKRSFPPGVRVVLGREADCHVVLPSHAVSRKHAIITLREKDIAIEDRSSLGTQVNQHKLHGGETVILEPLASLRIGPYELEVRRSEHRVQSSDQRRRAHAMLLERLRLETRRIGTEITPELRTEVQKALEEIVLDPELAIADADKPRLARELYDEALGLGPLEALLADKNVSEIMVVDPTNIYAERAGILELTGRAFTDAEAVRSAIERIVTPLGRRIDESSPLVDARLPDGSRVNAVIPPLALRGPCITIRKFPSRRLTMKELVQKGSLNERMARFLERSVALKKNIVISGGTGSGKTTLLNVLSASIGAHERVVTIEDAAELQLSQAHVVGLESKPPNLEGRGEFTIRDLLKNALRMRPDRIVVGECRGGEALDMLQAMNTGHEGSMTTTHANSPRQAVSRLETLCLMAGIDLPLSAIRRQIADSIHLVVQQSRLGDGTRRVTMIAEVVGINAEGVVDLRTIFEFQPAGVDKPASHEATGFMPTYLAELERVFGDAEGALL
jgi:pilus assembly protein CpaF